MKIDNAAHEFIIEDLDEGTLVVKESRLPELKSLLEAVSVKLSRFESASDVDVSRSLLRLSRCPRTLSQNDHDKYLPAMRMTILKASMFRT
jgi:hypothetical protein